MDEMMNMGNKKEENSTAMAVIDAVPKKKNTVAYQPNCIYAECVENGFCDKCNRKCDGTINAKGIKAQIMEGSKMCLKVGEDPVIYFVNKEEGDQIINGTKAAYITFAIGKEELNKFLDDKEQKYKIKIFFGVKED